MDGPRPGVYMRSFRWFRQSRLWVLPTAGVVVALALAAVTLTVDRLVLEPGAPFPVFTGTQDTARQVLVVIATSIATLTALVLTVVAVVIQLATQALSPRAVRTFLHDVHSHVTIGMFVATFTFVLIVLEQLGLTLDGDGEQVASISVTIAFLLAVVSLGMFIAYVDHIVHQARVTSILDRIGNTTRHVIDLEYPDEFGEGPTTTGRLPEGEPDTTVATPTHGSVIEIDVDAVVAAAAKTDSFVVMVPAVGDFLPAGATLFEVYGNGDSDQLGLLGHIDIDVERTIAQDVAFGFRLLVDIAERSLSPGINDPTTAVQALDQLHDLLRRLGHRSFPTGWHHDDGGTARLYVRPVSWETFVALALDEIRQYGADSVQVSRRIRSLLEDLGAHIPEERQPPLRRQFRLLDEALRAVRAPGLDAEAARHADRQGIGSTPEGFADDHGDPEG